MSSSTAKDLLTVSSIGFVVSEVTIRARSARHRVGTRRDRGSILAVVTGLAAGAIGAVRCALALPGATVPGWAPVLAGVALMWLGVALRQWSVRVLGRSFTVAVRVTEGQQVVTGGPYRWVRHPAYSGLLLTTAGFGLALGNWVSLLCAVLLPALGLVVRIRVEERALSEALGAPYREYAAGRRRLVPGIW